MKKALFVIAIMLLLVPVTCNAKETKKEYAIVTVHETYDNVWKIEHNNNIYDYTDLDFPIDTVYIIAEVSGEYPELIKAIPEIGNMHKRK